jgi:hypothetical protein
LTARAAQAIRAVMTARLLCILPVLLALAGCVSAPAVKNGNGKPTAIRTAPRPPNRQISPTRLSPPPPRPAALVQVAPGLEGVIGADADQLTRLFGTPRLDIRDEDTRKLQWTGPACVLDAYLYQGARGGRATATYVDARRGDGRDVDRAACIAALRRKPPVPSAP